MGKMYDDNMMVCIWRMYGVCGNDMVTHNQKETIENDPVKLKKKKNFFQQNICGKTIFREEQKK